jgi:hypothetical protein
MNRKKWKKLYQAPTLAKVSLKCGFEMPGGAPQGLHQRWCSGFSRFALQCATILAIAASVEDNQTE